MEHDSSTPPRILLVDYDALMRDSLKLLLRQHYQVTVRLPLMQHQREILQQMKASEPSLGLQGIKVLVVDDTADMREYVTFVLEQSGANVIAVASAAEALAVLAQFQPAALISDIGKAEMDGYILMRRVRSLPPEQGGQIPALSEALPKAIALTANN